MRKVMILAATALLFCIGCTSGNNLRPIIQTSAAENYPLPAVPPTITEPAERASIICARFWDDAVFPTHGGDSISLELEQAMANFAAIAPLAAEPDSVSRGIAELLRKGGRDYIMPLAERYLYNGDSPVRNDEIFLLFLQAAPGWERTGHLMPELLKNRVGSTAADFNFTDTRGQSHSLSKFVNDNGSTLIYFFDPACDLCQQLIPAAEKAAGGAALLAICVADTAGLRASTTHFPPAWTIATDLGQINAADLYTFPTLPAAYLLAPDLTVIARNIKL